jgi:hypothetical protein
MAEMAQPAPRTDCLWLDPDSADIGPPYYKLKHPECPECGTPARISIALIEHLPEAFGYDCWCHMYMYFTRKRVN